MASDVALPVSATAELNCYLGQSCTIKQKLGIGRGSTVGMAAAVIRDVSVGSVVLGNLGRVLVNRAEW